MLSEILSPAGFVHPDILFCLAMHITIFLDSS